jgi:vancomycin resistance protein YoaR
MASLNKHIRRVLRLLKIPMAIAILITIAVLTDLIINRDFIYPNVSVAGNDLTRTTLGDASRILESKLSKVNEVKVTGSEETYTLKTQDIKLEYDVNASTQRAFNLTRSGNILYDLNKKIELLRSPVNMGLIVNYDEAELDKFVSIIAGQEGTEAVYPSIKTSGGKVTVEKGKTGKEVDIELLKALVGKSLAYGNTEEIKIPLSTIDPTLSDEEAEKAKLRGETISAKNLTLVYESENFVFSGEKMISFIDPKGNYKSEELNKEIEKVANKVNREAQNPKFSFDGGRVTEFLPAKEGVEVNREEMYKVFFDSLKKLELENEPKLTVNIPVKTTPPLVTTDKVNNLGIKEMIGRGTSTYFGSIPGRVHNVALATSRINGSLIAPGETFSFNETLGDVSKFTGYKEAYIISQGKTILGDGGGVCQVSTTLFRSLLNAGLPITERAAHAYRVGYYEQSSSPGLDATVYGPSPDLKFKNDTGNHILIQAFADTKNYSLVFELYGTKDGRTATMTKPVLSNVTPPPEDVYQDDPSLPAGTIKQIEHKAWGARATFSYTVEKDGETIFQKTFTSNYRPWQAVYLRGTGV